MTTRRTGATTSPSGPTTRRSPTRCPRWPSGSGRWGSPRSISSKRTVRRSAWPSLGLEHQALHERGQVRPRFAVRACDRLEGGRVLHVRGHALRDALLERQHVLVLVENADRDAVSPLEGLFQRLRGLLLDFGRLVDHRIEAFILELVDARQRSPRRGVLAILAPVTLFSIEFVVRRSRLEDIEERVAFVLNPLFDRRDEMFDVVRVAAADPSRPRGERAPARTDGLVDVRMGEGLRLDAELEGRRGLALRQPVDAVVVDDVQHVQVPTARIHEVPAADPEAVSVPAQAEDLQLRIRQLDAGGVR